MVPKLEMGYCFGIFEPFCSQISSLWQLLQLATAGLHIIGYCCSAATFLELAQMLFNLTEFFFCYVEPCLVFDMLYICQFLCICILHNCVVYYVTCIICSFSSNAFMISYQLHHWEEVQV